MKGHSCESVDLDNFDHVTAYWISTGLPLAQIALSYGADDLHGTIGEEKIFHMAERKRRKGKLVAIWRGRFGKRGGSRCREIRSTSRF